MTDMNKRITFVCETCGSDDVTSDALAHWEVATQQWELRSTLDNCSCERCATDTRLVVVELATIDG